jgi:hypothetical protein
LERFGDAAIDFQILKHLAPSNERGKAGWIDVHRQRNVDFNDTGGRESPRPREWELGINPEHSTEEAEDLRNPQNPQVAISRDLQTREFTRMVPATQATFDRVDNVCGQNEGERPSLQGGNDEMENQAESPPGHSLDRRQLRMDN